MTLRSRFAPSPTGTLHLGSVRTALFAWAHAKHHQGQFIVRIEDTDRERSTKDNVQVIFDALDWLGLKSDEPVVLQTSRLARYDEVIEQLLVENKAYYCTCSKARLDELREGQRAAGEKPRYDGLCRDAKHAQSEQTVVRFKNPQSGTTAYQDLVYGQIEVANAEMDDFIIRRSDGMATYNFAVVIDDHDMNMNCVIRGEDHINNTPRQINVYQALGWDVPEFAHLPMVLGEDGSKLSKRHGAVSTLALKEQGILPEALLSALVRVGWSHGDDELFTREQIIKHFDVRDANKASGGFSHTKLLWVNQQFMQQLSPDELAKLANPFFAQAGIDVTQGPDLTEVVALLQERCKTLVELAEQGRYFYVAPDHFDEKAAKKHLRPVVLEPVQTVRASLAALTEWTQETIHECIHTTAEQLDVGMGKIGQPLRVAVSGGAVSPAIDATLALLPQADVLARIDKALVYLADRAAA